MTDQDVLYKFEKLSNKNKVIVMELVIEYMQQYNGRSVTECYKLAMQEFLTKK